jgi:DNA-binding NtrC family response regulator
MAAPQTLLCIHRNPAQLGLLEENGYQLATAANSSDGLRLFMTRWVDAVIIEHYPGLLDGVTAADEMRRVRPQVPIVVLADHAGLPGSALKSVDAIVVKSDGPHFLLATVYFVLNVKPVQQHAGKRRSQKPLPSSRSQVGARRGGAFASHDKHAPFSQSVWRSIQNGTIKF